MSIKWRRAKWGLKGLPAPTSHHSQTRKAILNDWCQAFIVFISRNLCKNQPWLRMNIKSHVIGLISLSILKLTRIDFYRFSYFSFYEHVEASLARPPRAFSRENAVSLHCNSRREPNRFTEKLSFQYIKLSCSYNVIYDTRDYPPHIPWSYTRIRSWPYKLFFSPKALFKSLPLTSSLPFLLVIANNDVKVN